MSNELYVSLADALDRLPNGFPRTSSGVEIEILKAIFVADEAALAATMTEKPEPPEQIAGRLGLEPETARKKLISMVGRGLLWMMPVDGKRGFRLAPFVVGIYEAQRSNLDHRLAHLVEEYMTSPEGLQLIMSIGPSLHRVVPARGAVKSEWVLPYDDVKAMILAAKSFRLSDCICRLQQDLLRQRKCDFPVRLCLGLSTAERPSGPTTVTQEEALAALDQAEELGMVHTVSNIVAGVSYVCNCCGCCCGILRGLTQFGYKESIACANYFAAVDVDKCTGCGTCENRCQVKAIAVGAEGVAVVDRSRCIGCGLCVTGCPDEAVQLNLKPDDEIIDPPVDFGTWEKLRRTNRGLARE